MFVMADVYTVTFIVIGILITFPALLVALNLLLPTASERAHLRLARTPGRCFALGLPLLIFVILWIVATAEAAAGPVRATAFIVGLFTLGLGALGSAGMVRLLAGRLGAVSDPNSKLTHLVRAAVVYELAGLVPLLGWLLFVPVMSILAFGAAVFALLGRAPRAAEEHADDALRIPSPSEQQAPN